MRSTSILLVEGSDDQHVIWNLLKYHNFPECFSVEEKSGVERLLSTFPVQVKGSGMDAVGIVIDADLNIFGRWQSIRSDLNNLGYATCPEQLPGEGLVLDEAGKPRVGVWIMPDNLASGMLEDFVSCLVPHSDNLWTYGASILEQMPPELREFSPNHFMKAHLHTWLAWKADPGTPMGLAITKKYLDAEAPAAAPFLEWLRRLFVRPAA